MEAEDSMSTIERWPLVQEFMDNDVCNPPDKGQILFIGSSILRQWTSLREHMSPLPILNRAFGGSRTEHVLEQMDNLVFPYEPKIIVYYCGGNDFNDGLAPEDVFSNFRLFSDRVKTTMPDTTIFYMSINKTPQKNQLGQFENIDLLNSFAENYCSQTEGREYVDVNVALLNIDGSTIDELYQEDGLHFKEDDVAYKSFAEILRPKLSEEWERKLV